MIKITIKVDDEIPEMLTLLAGGERKWGQWISDTARALYNQQQYIGDDVHMIQIGLGGLAGQVKHIDARLSRLEAQNANPTP